MQGLARRPEGEGGGGAGRDDFGTAGQTGADVRPRGGCGRRSRQRRGCEFDAVDDRPEPSVALCQLRLAFEQFADLGFHQLLVEHLATGDAVDLCAQCRYPVFISLLQARLACRSSADQIVPQHQIGRGEKVADGDRCQGRAEERCKPWADGEVTDLVAARNDDGVRLAASSENSSLTSIFHGTELPYRSNCDMADYTLLGLTKLFGCLVKAEIVAIQGLLAAGSPRRQKKARSAGRPGKNFYGNWRGFAVR